MIPILTLEQKEWLEKAKQLAQHKSHSLIPTDTLYKTYRSRFDKVCKRAGSHITLGKTLLFSLSFPNTACHSCFRRNDDSLKVSPLVIP